MRPSQDETRAFLRAIGHPAQADDLPSIRLVQDVIEALQRAPYMALTKEAPAGEGEGSCSQP